MEGTLKKQGTAGRTLQGAFGKALEGNGFLLFDGAMGTMLQQSGLQPGELPEMLCQENPKAISAIHRAYVEAGSNVVTTNTFGANRVKLGDNASVSEIFELAVKCARNSEASLVAADVGPIGKLIFPMGDLSFTEAFDLFAEQGKAISNTDADIVIIETMADILEMTAAVLGIRSQCSLPLFATMTFTAQGRTFLGTSPTDVAIALSLLGVDALGVNCSAGPADLAPVVHEMLRIAMCPVIVQANAGIPKVIDGKTIYEMNPESYALEVLQMIEDGASIIGGCCGTDPRFIEAIAKLVDNRTPKPRPCNHEKFLELAREAADEGSRDADIIAEILAAEDDDALKQALVDEYDLD